MGVAKTAKLQPHHPRQLERGPIARPGNMWVADPHVRDVFVICHRSHANAPRLSYLACVRVTTRAGAHC